MRGKVIVWLSCFVFFISVFSIPQAFSYQDDDLLMEGENEGYSRYPGDPDPRDNYDWYEVRRLAQRIESDTVDLRRKAERASRGTWDEQRALRDLRTLESRASQFRRTVEWYSGGSSWVARDYRELARAYKEAGYTFSVVSSFWHLQYDFERIGQYIQTVRRYLGNTEDPYPYHRSI